MAATWILLSIVCYVNTVSGQNASSIAGAATVAATVAATKTASSVSASKPDCAPPLVCPAVKCLFPVTPPGHCCSVCLPGIYSFFYC